MTSSLFALLLSLQVTAPVPASVQSVANRANAFQTRLAKVEPLPTFEASRALLPQPIVDDHADWVALYWRAWELAFAHLKQPEPGSGFISNFIDPAFNENTFQWDTCFMLQFAHYAEPEFHAIGSLDNFYVKQHADGFICREISRATGKDYYFGGIVNSVNPPLFSWVEWQNYTLTGDKGRFRDVLPVLIRHYLWLRGNRRRPSGHYWTTGLGAGEDDLARNDSTYAWMDLTTQQAQNAYYIARIAEQIGEKDVERFFDGENRELSKLVNATMWSPKDRFYYDLRPDGQPTGIKTVLGFWPLIARIAGKSQAKDLAAHLQNEHEFWRPDVVPALSADAKGYRADGQYWNGAVWAPTNFVVIKGLEAYGMNGLARRLTTRYLSNMATVLKDTGTIWENYAPESATGHGARDMVGWSGDGPISLLIETELGIQAFAADKEAYWSPRLPGRNGVENLTVGKTHLSLVAGPLQDGVRELTMTSDGPLTLHIDTGVGRQHLVRLTSGTRRMTVKALVEPSI